MASDPYYGNVALLLHCDGSDGSTTFTDSSISPKTVTAHGNAQIDTSDADFGGGAGLLDGVGDWLEIPNHADFNPGSSDFTFEIRFKLTAYAQNNGEFYYATLIGKDIEAARAFGLRIGGTSSSYNSIEFYGCSNNATEFIVAITTTFNLNTLYSVALSRVGNLIYIAKDGVILTPGGSAFSVAIQSTTAPLLIGSTSYNTTYKFDFPGRFDEARWTAGVGRYAADYTPSFPFPPSPYNDTPAQLALAFTGNTPTIPYRATPAQLALAFTGNTPRLANTSPFEPAQLALVFTGNTPTASVIRPYSDTPAQLALTFTGNAPTLGYVVIAKPVVIGRRYKCTITGAADALPDIEIPISSINGRLTNDGMSSLSIVCPDGVGYAAAIAARSNGGLIIESIEDYADGSSASDFSVEYPITGYASDRGSQNWSITISVSTTLTLGQARRVNLKGISYLGRALTGKTRARCELDKDLLPGDVAMLDDGSEYTCGSITYVIGAAGRFMEVSQ